MSSDDALEAMEPAARGYAVQVGSRLRAIRKQKRLSLQEVESGSGHEFKASVLGAYERGERAISVPRLHRLARFYGVPVDQLLPPDPAARADADTIIDLDEGTISRRGTADRVTLDLHRLSAMESPDAEQLARYLGVIQVQRGDFNGRVLTVRRDDVRAIACLLDTTPDGARARLDELGLRITT